MHIPFMLASSAQRSSRKSRSHCVPPSLLERSVDGAYADSAWDSVDTSFGLPVLHSGVSTGRVSCASEGGLTAMTTLAGLLICAAVLEGLAGMVLILAPGVAIVLLFGEAPGATSSMVGRLAGIALLSLGIAGWGAHANGAGPARTGTVRGITLYNAGAGLLLIAVATSWRSAGVAAWVAGILHLGLAAA